MSPSSARSLLNIWSNDSSSLFVSFKSGECCGSTRCVIAHSDSNIKLSWVSDFSPGELVVSLETASFEIDVVRIGKLLSGASRMGEGELCLSIKFPSGDWLLLVKTPPLTRDDLKDIIGA